MVIAATTLTSFVQQASPHLSSTITMLPVYCVCDILGTIESCTDYSIRLVNGADELQGRVEVCIEGKWGTVCHHKWTNDDARVVCASLDHPNSGTFPFHVQLSKKVKIM